jgi:hypothetical protein
LTDSSGAHTQRSGYKSTARQKIMDGLTGDPSFGALVIQGTNPKVKPLRAISADNGVINVLNKTPNVPTFDPVLYTSYIAEVWQAYTTETLTILTSAFGTYAGRVNAENQMILRQTDATRPNQEPIAVSYPAPTDASATERSSEIVRARHPARSPTTIWLAARSGASCRRRSIDRRCWYSPHSCATRRARCPTLRSSTRTSR